MTRRKAAPRFYLDDLDSHRLDAILAEVPPHRWEKRYRPVRWTAMLLLVAIALSVAAGAVAYLHNPAQTLDLLRLAQGRLLALWTQAAAWLIEQGERAGDWAEDLIAMVQAWLA